MGALAKRGRRSVVSAFAVAALLWPADAVAEGEIMQGDAGVAPLSPDSTGGDASIVLHMNPYDGREESVNERIDAWDDSSTTDSTEAPVDGPKANDALEPAGSGSDDPGADLEAPVDEISELPPLPDFAPLLPPISSAQESTGPSERRFLSHFLSLNSSVFYSDVPKAADPLWFELEYRPRLARDLAWGLSMVAELFFRTSVSKQSGDRKTEADGNWWRFSDGEMRFENNRTFFAPKELSVAWTGGIVSVEAGWKILSWGHSDGIRPLDVFQVQDRTDPLRPEAMGVPSLSTTLSENNWSVEAVWVPTSVFDRIAVDPSNVFSVLPRTVVATYDDQTVPDFSLRNGELGFRTAWNNQSWDLAVIAAFTRDRAPSVLQLRPGVVEGTIVVAPEMRRFWMHGVSLVRSLGEYIARADVAYVNYEESQGRLLKDGVRLVAGVETHGDLWGNANYTAILQYATDTSSPGRALQEAGFAASPYRWFRHAASLALNVAMGDTLDLEVRGLLELERWGAVPSATLKYQFSSSGTIWGRADVVAGGDGTFIGRLAYADRFIVGIDFFTQ